MRAVGDEEAAGDEVTFRPSVSYAAARLLITKDTLPDRSYGLSPIRYVVPYDNSNGDVQATFAVDGGEARVVGVGESIFPASSYL